jgi:hypothetical protein
MGLILNIDKIEKIYTHKAKQSNRISYDLGQPEKYTFFGLIKTQDEIKPHWSGWYGESYPTREKFVDANTEYFINDEVLFENSIWEKPHMYIVMSHSDNVTIYYDSYEELNEKLTTIINESKRNLMVIKQ